MHAYREGKVGRVAVCHHSQGLPPEVCAYRGGKVGRVAVCHHSQGLPPEVCVHTGKGRWVGWLYVIIHRDFPLRCAHIQGREGGVVAVSSCRWVGRK